jgi:hypothetical protein
MTDQTPATPHTEEKWRWECRTCGVVSSYWASSKALAGKYAYHATHGNHDVAIVQKERPKPATPERWSVEPKQVAGILRGVAGEMRSAGYVVAFAIMTDAATLIDQQAERIKYLEFQWQEAERVSVECVKMMPHIEGVPGSNAINGLYQAIRLRNELIDQQAAELSRKDEALREIRFMVVARRPWVEMLPFFDAALSGEKETP